MVKLISSKDFNEILKNNVVLVDFYAKWCGPCKMISPIIDELSNQIDDVEFAKIDIDESSDIASMLGITSIPTLIIFKNGKQVDKRVGFMSKNEIINFINQNK